MADPIVTVGIPTYNRASLLRGAIESVLSQTFHDFQLLVVDNASEDQTDTVVQSYDDGRIRYVRNARNIGIPGNWNRCFALATGRYITILPDDDLMMPENLEAKVGMLNSHAQVGLVHSKFHTIDGDGKIIRYNTNWGHGVDRDRDAIESGRDVLKEMLLTYNRINAPTVVFRRACYEKLGGYTDGLTLTEDWEFWMRIAAHYDVAFLASPLIKWRIHSGSETSQRAHDEGHGPNDLAFMEHLGAKRLILKNPLHADILGRQLIEQVWRTMCRETIYRAQCMWKHGKTNYQTRMFVIGTLRAIPELILYKNIWKVLVGNILGRQAIDFLKRFFLSGAQKP